MEMMRNPNAMREAMRSQDLQMSQLENIPGGFNAMRRMFEEVQEPMMEASQAMHGQQAPAGGSNAAVGNNSTNTTSINDEYIFSIIINLMSLFVDCYCNLSLSFGLSENF